MKAVNKAFALFQTNAVPKYIGRTVTEQTKAGDVQLFIKADKHHISVQLEDIFYLESYSNYVKVWLEKECYLTPKTLNHFTETLNEYLFFKIHKSLIINEMHINCAKGNMVVMRKGKQLPIGKMQRSSFKKFIAGN